MTGEQHGRPSTSGAAADRVVSVVVPTFEDPRLPSCLEALTALQVPAGWRLELVVVDNGSADPPRDLVEAVPGAVFLVEPRRGSYAARNTALTVASGEVVAFTDSDCRPDPDWLVVAVRRLEEDPGLAAVVGRVRTVFDSGRPTTPVGWWEAVEAFPQERYVAMGFGVTANLVVRRSVGDAVGWFDDEAQSGADVGFGRALTGSGLRLAYEARAVVSHPARTSWRELSTKGRRTAQGYARREWNQGKRLSSVLMSVRWLVLGMLSVVKRSVTRRELTGPWPRVQYLAVGLAFRVFWFVERCRGYLQLRREARA